jgi:hypothetical protein
MALAQSFWLFELRLVTAVTVFTNCIKVVSLRGYRYKFIEYVASETI